MGNATHSGEAERPSRWPLAVFGLFTSLFLLGAVGVFAHRTTLERMASTRSVARTHEVIGALEGLLFRLSEAESAWLAGVVTGAGSGELSAQSHEAAEQLSRIRQLTVDEASQQRRLEALGPLVRDRLKQLAQSVGENAADDPARHAVHVERGRGLMGPIRAAVQAMIDEEMRLLEQREERAAAMARTSLAALTAGFGLGALLLVLAFAALWRENAQRAEAEANAHHLAELATRSEARVQKLLDSTPDAVVVVRPDGSIERVNDHTLTLFGYARDELLGQPVERLIPERFRGRHTEHRASYHEQPVVRPMGAAGATLFGRHKDGREFPASISLSPLETERGRYAIAAVRDVTEQHRAAEALVLAKRQADEANRELEAFSYSVAHDLRAPLRAIDGFSKALLEDYGEKLDDQGKQYLGYVVKSANHMAELIDDLLSLSRVARAELTKQPVDVSALARQVMERVTRDRGERSLALRIEDGLEAHADPRLLAIVLENLLGNAWKFTRDKSPAHITVGRLNGGERGFFVRDDGAGFDMAYAGKLFGAFQRLHRESEFEGTGIGLATVKRIVHRHGGRIWAEGERGKGATFMFTLGTGEPS